MTIITNLKTLIPYAMVFKQTKICADHLLKLFGSKNILTDFKIVKQRLKKFFNSILNNFLCQKLKYI